MSNATMLVTIRGRVHGVGYRAWLEDQARASGLDGWVRNRRDGAVEALFSGRATVVAEMVALCRHGPPLARVEGVISETADEDQLQLRHAGERFSVLPTI